MAETLELLNLDGIPSDSCLGDGQPFFAFDGHGSYRVSEGDRSFEIDAACVLLLDAFENVIMHEVSFRELSFLLPNFVTEAGHDSECPVSREQFEKFLNDFSSFPEINRFLYLYDCHQLVKSIKHCNQEIVQSVGSFYFSLNKEEIFCRSVKHRAGVVHASSPATVKIFSYLTFIFIRMHSILDYVVKMAIEAERLRSDFTTYARMSSHGMQFGNRKKVNFDGAIGTLLESCEFINTIQSLRNHVIHDGLLDSRPKVYERFEDGLVVERFVLFPDMTEGRFDKFGNRKLFYGKESKINFWLPDFVNEFQRRQEVSLARVLVILQDRKFTMTGSQLSHRGSS